MSRAHGIRGLFASQTCVPWIQIASDLNHWKQASKMLPKLGTHGLRAEEVRRYGKTFRIALSGFGRQH